MRIDTYLLRYYVLLMPKGGASIMYEFTAGNCNKQYMYTFFANDNNNA